MYKPYVVRQSWFYPCLEFAYMKLLYDVIILCEVKVCCRWFIAKHFSYKWIIIGYPLLYVYFGVEFFGCVKIVHSLWKNLIKKCLKIWHVNNIIINIMKIITVDNVDYYLGTELIKSIQSYRSSRSLIFEQNISEQHYIIAKQVNKCWIKLNDVSIDNTNKSRKVLFCKNFIDTDEGIQKYMGKNKR